MNSGYQLYQHHQQLDALVLQAYGLSPDDDPLKNRVGGATPQEYRPPPRPRGERKAR